jgi:hypothetical protein
MLTLKFQNSFLELKNSFKIFEKLNYFFLSDLHWNKKLNPSLKSIIPHFELKLSSCYYFRLFENLYHLNY